MKVEEVTRLNIAGTMRKMEPGDWFQASAMRDHSIRSVASRLRGEGFDFDVNRKGDIMEVVCIKRPENKEEK